MELLKRFIGCEIEVKMASRIRVADVVDGDTFTGILRGVDDGIGAGFELEVDHMNTAAPTLRIVNWHAVESVTVLS